MFSPLSLITRLPVKVTLPASNKKTINLGFLSVSVSGFARSDGLFSFTGSASTTGNVFGVTASTGQIVVADRTTASERWPGLASEARRFGVQSFLSIPLPALEPGVRAGAVNVYGSRADGFARSEVALMNLFTTAAGYAIGSTERYRGARQLALQLERALEHLKHPGPQRAEIRQGTQLADGLVELGVLEVALGGRQHEEGGRAFKAPVQLELDRGQGLGLGAAHGGSEGEGGDEEDDVEDGLGAGLQVAADGVGVGIAAKEEQLEKQHARRPHRRSSAEPGQQHLAHQQLQHEQQKRREKGDSGGEHGADT